MAAFETVTPKRRRDAWIVFGGVALVAGAWLLGGAELLLVGGSVAIGRSEARIPLPPGGPAWGPAFTEAGLFASTAIPTIAAVLCLPYGCFWARRVPRLRWFGAAVVAAGALALLARFLLFVMAMGAVLG